MKYKIIKEIPPEKKIPQPFEIKDNSLWHCERCEILYGKGEIILSWVDGGKLCPIHKDRIYSADLDYWREKYELELLNK